MEKQSSDDRLTHFINGLVGGLGSIPAIFAAFSCLLLWSITGPFLGFSDTWQLIINTSTTIVTFMMTFIILNAQNRDGRAIQTKLDAIICSLEGVDNSLQGLEERPDKVIKERQQEVRHEDRPDLS